MKRTSIFVIIIYSIFLSFLNAQGLKEVKVQLKWKHQFQFAGFYAAIEKGYYKAVGLDVRLIEADSIREPIKEVLKQNAEFGVGTSELILNRNNNEPVVVVANIFQYSPLCLIAQKGIKSLKDLKGKNVEIETNSSELFAYFIKEGIDPKVIKISSHKFNIKDFLENKVDAISAYETDELFELEKSDHQYEVFSPRQNKIDFYGDNIFTTEKFLKENPKLVQDFKLATLKGWKYAMYNSQEIIDLIINKYSKRHSREHLLFEAEKTKKLINPQKIKIGKIDLKKWDKIAKEYAKLKMLNKNYSLVGFLLLK